MSLQPDPSMADHPFVKEWNALAQRVHQCAVDKGFYTSGSKEMTYVLAWMGSELGEAFEALREGNPESKKIPGFTHFEEEIADVVILALDMAQNHGFNIGEAIVRKYLYNTTRERLHGKAR